MSEINKEDTYRFMPYYNETANTDSYIYSDLKDLAEKCNMDKYEITKCRSVGILQSINGRFYLSEINNPCGISEPVVQVSVVYLKSPPPSTVIPYPVQVFGTMQWKNRPVLFANLLQVMSAATAIRVKNALNNIATKHSASLLPDEAPVDQISCGDLTINELNTTFNDITPSEIT